MFTTRGGWLTSEAWQPWLVPLADVAVRGLVLLLAIVLVALALRRSSAARRYLVWSLGVIGLLVLPLLSATLPAWRVLPRGLAESKTETSPAESFASAEGVVPFRDTKRGGIDPSDGPAIVTGIVKPEASARPNVAVALSTSTPAGNSPSRLAWLAPLWLMGVLLVLLPPAAGLWQLACLLRKSTPLTDVAWAQLLADLCAQLRIRRRVRLLRSPSAAMPLTFGVWRPILLIPAEADRWSQERRRLVLLHELAHIRRFDWLTQMLAHAACAVHWFNPLAWLAARRMHVEREQACDDLVITTGAKASDYARELLDIAANYHDRPLMALAAAPMARQSALEGRLRAVLDGKRNRAALTAMTGLLALTLLAAVLVPLAMMQASDPQPPAAKPDPKPQATDAPPVAPDPAPAKPEAPMNGIRLSVLNSKGDGPIKEFRVIAGVRAGSVSQEYEKRTGRTVVNWQPHMVRIGKDGEYVWPLDRGYDEMALRIEADGYQPQIWAWIKKADGPKHLIFKLPSDPGVKGQVMQPDGKPAAGATVALAMVQRDARLENGIIRGSDKPLPNDPVARWRLPVFATTDADGRFQLPTEFEPAAVLVVHESGVRELAYENFQKSPDITLQRWGRVEGRVLWQDKPGANEPLSLGVHRDIYGYPGVIAAHAEVVSDAEGRFVFDKMLPGLAQLSRITKVSDSVSAILPGMFAHIRIKAGDPTAAMIGGQGRKVTGKLTGRDSWENVTFHFHPKRPHIGFGGDDATWKAYGEFRESPIGPLFFRDKQPVNADGSFAIENMLPGQYQFYVSAPGANGQLAYDTINVDQETPGQNPPVLDLGQIPIKDPKMPPQDQGEGGAKKAADPAPAPPKAVNVRGKVIDDETGEPVTRLITQAGHFDPADPTKITWGYSETTSGNENSSFFASIRWSEGWTARILADGYLPHPIFLKAPPEGKTDIEMVIRLKRGRMVRGQVLNHEDQPVKGAAVFAVGHATLNLVAGKAWNWGEENKFVKPALTDEKGRFELATGDAKSVAVSSAAMDAWPAVIPEKGDVTIRLPAPARIDVQLDIDGAEQESKVFYQLIGSYMPGFERLESYRNLPIKNGGKLSITGLTPGKYQFSRGVTNRIGDMSASGMLDREFFELKAGEAKQINFVRAKGARVRGKITGPEGTKFTGIVVSIKSEKAQKALFGGDDWQTTFASQTADANGTFLTERVSPGAYLLVAEGYTPPKPEQKGRLGMGRSSPSFRAEIKIDVPETGEVQVAELKLLPIR